MWGEDGGEGVGGILGKIYYQEHIIEGGERVSYLHVYVVQTQNAKSHDRNQSYI